MLAYNSRLMISANLAEDLLNVCMEVNEVRQSVASNDAVRAEVMYQ